MSKLTAEQYQEKQARRLKQSTEDIRIGIMAVKEAPGIKAAKKADKMLRNLTESVTSGRWGRAVSAVPLEKWQKDTIEKGLARIPAGIDAAKDKTIAFAARLLPFQDALSAKVDAMPDSTLEDSIARMTEWTRGMSNFKNRS